MPDFPALPPRRPHLLVAVFAAWACCLGAWSERRGSNPRPLVPQTSALPLRHARIGFLPLRSGFDERLLAHMGWTVIALRRRSRFPCFAEVVLAVISVVILVVVSAGRVRVAPGGCAGRDASLYPVTWLGCALTRFSGLLRRDRLAGHRTDEYRSSPPRGASLAMSKSGRGEDRFWWFFTSGSSRICLNRMPFPRFLGEFGSGSSVGVQSPGCGFWRLSPARFHRRRATCHGRIFISGPGSIMISPAAIGGGNHDAAYGERHRDGGECRWHRRDLPGYRFHRSPAGIACRSKSDMGSLLIRQAIFLWFEKIFFLCVEAARVVGVCASRLLGNQDWRCVSCCLLGRRAALGRSCFAAPISLTNPPCFSMQDMRCST